MDSNRSTVTGCRRWICVEIPNSIDALYRTGRSRGLSPTIESGVVYAFDCVKRTPLLGKGGVDAPSRYIPVPLQGADGVVRSNSKRILVNEPPRRCELIVIRRYSPPCTTARRGGCVIKENLAKPPKQTQPGWFSFWIHRKTTPASR